LHEITGQVLGVQGRQSKNGQHTLYDVAFSDGNKYTTFEADLANTANALVGQQVSAHVDVKQNGKYTNYNLEAIAPQGQLAQPALQAGTPVTFPVGHQLVGSGTSSIPITPPQQSGGWSEEKDQRITKLALLKLASCLVGSLFSGAGPEALEEAQAKTVALAKELYVQIFAGPVGATPATPAATPAEVAASVPGVQVGAVSEQLAHDKKPRPEW
jgi:hypothetical protein